MCGVTCTQTRTAAPIPSSTHACTYIYICKHTTNAHLRLVVFSWIEDGVGAFANAGTLLRLHANARGVGRMQASDDAPRATRPSLGSKTENAGAGEALRECAVEGRANGSTSRSANTMWEHRGARPATPVTALPLTIPAVGGLPTAPMCCLTCMRMRSNELLPDVSCVFHEETHATHRRARQMDLRGPGSRSVTQIPRPTQLAFRLQCPHAVLMSQFAGKLSNLILESI